MRLGPGRVALAVNAGSGSVSVAAFGAREEAESVDSHEDLRPVWTMKVVRHASPQRVTIEGDGERRELEIDAPDARSAVAPGLDALWSGPTAVVDGPDAVACVGHRIVHGGPTLDAPAEIDARVRAAIEAAARFAPLHNPPGLELVELARERLPDARHVACFDTAFHRTIPTAARAYGGPASWLERGLVRYGFHGISHADAARRAARLLGRAPEDANVITVHLGGGCSATAVRGGRSVATTMGLTPADGMVMATRSGAVDPGLLLHLMREDGLDADALETLLEKESGLMGLTRGASGDVGRVRELADAGDADARLAIDVYAHRARREIAALRPALDGLDALVFTGSAVTGEPWLRAAICDGLEYLGVRLDAARDAAAGDGDEIGAGGACGASVRAYLLHADEDRVIAGAALAAG